MKITEKLRAKANNLIGESPVAIAFLGDSVTQGCFDVYPTSPDSLQTYFDEQNRNTKIIVPTNAVETYNSDNHKRDEYNEIAFKIMNQTGIKLVKKYGGNYGK